jgi:hypothetical protein
MARKPRIIKGSERFFSHYWIEVCVLLGSFTGMARKPRVKRVRDTIFFENYLRLCCVTRYVANLVFVQLSSNVCTGNLQHNGVILERLSRKSMMSGSFHFGGCGDSCEPGGGSFSKAWRLRAMLTST